MKKIILFLIINIFLLFFEVSAQKIQKNVKYFQRKDVKFSYHYISLGAVYSFYMPVINNNEDIQFPGLGLNIRGVWFFSKNIGLVGQFELTKLGLQSDPIQLENQALLQENENIKLSNRSYNLISASTGVIYSFSPINNFFIGIGGLVGYMKGIGAQGNTSLSVNEDTYYFNRNSEFSGLKLSGLISLKYQTSKKFGFGLSFEPAFIPIHYVNEDRFYSNENVTINNFNWSQSSTIFIGNVNLSVHYYFIRIFEKYYKSK